MHLRIEQREKGRKLRIQRISIHIVKNTECRPSQNWSIQPIMLAKIRILDNIYRHHTHRIHKHTNKHHYYHQSDDGCDLLPKMLYRFNVYFEMNR